MVVVLTWLLVNTKAKLDKVMNCPVNVKMVFNIYGAVHNWRVSFLDELIYLPC
ncbi:MAG: hypothetical protein K0S80_3839 [Neobacillus sp.]|nr:hypothetical protein [Neobacillus sp.]